MRLYRFLSITFFGCFLMCPVEAGQEDPRLDGLFKVLATSKTLESAKSIEQSIWDIWIENKEPSVSRVMAIGIQAMNAGALSDALQAFNEVIKMAPEFAEGWNKRATVYYLMQDFPASVKDIAETLRLESRHFGALSGLGLINTSLGRYDAAIKAFEQAIIIHPHMNGVRQNLKRLKELIRGEET